MKATEIVWFRRDLRVHDHPALTAAVREAEHVVPVFVLDDRLLDGRFPSEAPAWFLLESLREALRARGGDLVVRHGPPERELPALARETGEHLAEPWKTDLAPDYLQPIVDHAQERRRAIARYRAAGQG